MYEICRVIRAFNPNFAMVHIDAAFVDSMAAITPLNGLGMLPGMKRELPLYLAAAQGAPVFDKSSLDDFTDAVLLWWRTNGKSFPAWALAARPPSRRALRSRQRRSAERWTRSLPSAFRRRFR